MPQEGFFWVLLAGLVVGAVFLLQWIWRRPLSAEALPSPSRDYSDSEVTPKPLLSQEEATLFNLIKLAAQDHMLVLAKLPILQVVAVRDRDEEARKTVMRTVQPIRLDAVLAHPGTLQAVKVVKFRKHPSDTVKPDTRERMVDTLLHAAGIGLVVLDPNQIYSIEQLTALLGLAEE